jgi:hypothetical protein
MKIPFNLENFSAAARTVAAIAGCVVICTGAEASAAQTTIDTLQARYGEHLLAVGPVTRVAPDGTPAEVIGQTIHRAPSGMSTPNTVAVGEVVAVFGTIEKDGTALADTVRGLNFNSVDGSTEVLLKGRVDDIQANVGKVSIGNMAVDYTPSLAAHSLLVAKGSLLEVRGVAFDSIHLVIASNVKSVGSMGSGVTTAVGSMGSGSPIATAKVGSMGSGHTAAVGSMGSGVTTAVGSMGSGSPTVTAKVGSMGSGHTAAVGSMGSGVTTAVGSMGSGSPTVTAKVGSMGSGHTAAVGSMGSGVTTAVGSMGSGSPTVTAKVGSMGSGHASAVGSMGSGSPTATPKVGSMGSGKQ